MLFFKLRHDENDFKEADFLMQKVKRMATTLPAKQQKEQGITTKRVNDILPELSNRIKFLAINEKVVNLITERDKVQ